MLTTRATGISRLGSVLALALGVAFSAALIGAAPAAAQNAPTQRNPDLVRLELKSTSPAIDVDRLVVYTAEVVDANDRSRDVTSETVLSFDPDGPCTQARTEGGIEVRCTKPGVYAVRGAITYPSLVSAPVLLEVTPPIPPDISSVEPGSTPPSKEVVVKGTTGSCNQAGTLTLEETAVSLSVSGAFEARFTVPRGTSPGTYQLQLSVGCDGQTQLARQELEVTNPPPPVAVDDAVTTAKDTSVTIDVMNNDRDPVVARLQVVRQPELPATAEEQPDGKIVYTPEAGFVGSDTFDYDYCGSVLTAAGQAPACDPATVTVTVGEPLPVAVDDTASTVRDKPVVIDIMNNDRHADVARLQVSQPKPPATAVEQPDGTVVYTPRPGFVGPDRFQYSYCRDITAARRAACGPATVTVTVTEPPVMPTISSVRPASTPPGRPVEVGGNTGSCSRSGTLALQGTAVSVPVTGDRSGNFVARFTVPPGTSPGAHMLELGVDCNGKLQQAEGLLTVRNHPPVAVDDAAITVQGTSVTIDVTANDTDPDDPDGYRTSIRATTPAHGTVDVGRDDRIRYIPGEGFAGQDQFQYSLCDIIDADGATDCGTATVTVTVEPLPVAVNDTASTVRNKPIAIPVTRNDINPDVAKLRMARSPGDGSATVQRDGNILYSPNQVFTGEDQFQYDYCGPDVNAAARIDCRPATVTVTVASVPVISSVRPGSTSPGKPVTVAGNTGSCNRAGTLTLQGTGIAVNIAADQNGNFATTLTAPKGTSPRDYQVELRVDCDRQFQLARAKLTVTNRPPKAVDDPASTTPDTPVTIDVTANDRDPDGDDGYPTRVLQGSQPTRGTIEVRSDQTIVYTPGKGFVGRDRFRYSFCDDIINAAGRADCGTATVTVSTSATACVPPPGGTPRLRVDPGKGSGGATLRITANVDPRLAACPLRLLLGGAPLDPDVRVGSDGSISEQRDVPNDAKSGPSPVKLATMSDQVLAEAPFQIVPRGLSLLLKLVIGAGALLAGALGRAAFRRWRAPRQERSRREFDQAPEDVRAEPHTSPVDVTVEPDRDQTRTYTVRLEPHRDTGTQTVQEMTR